MTTVHEQITDSETQVNTSVMGEIPATAMGNLFISTGQALGNAGQNAASGNQQAFISMQAVTAQGVNSLLNTGSAVAGRTVIEIIEKG